MSEEDDREYEPAGPDAKVEFAAENGVFVYRFYPGGDEPVIVAKLGYGSCEWLLAAHHAAMAGEDFSRLLPIDTVEKGKRILFAAAIAEGSSQGWGLEIAAPFGIAGWRLLHSTTDEDGVDMLKTLTLAIHQADALP